MPENIVSILQVVLNVGALAFLFHSLGQIGKYHDNLERAHMALGDHCVSMTIEISRMWIRLAMIDMQMGHIPPSVVKEMIRDSVLPDVLKEESSRLLKEICEIYNLNEEA